MPHLLKMRTKLCGQQLIFAASKVNAVGSTVFRTSGCANAKFDHGVLSFLDSGFRLLHISDG